MEFPVRLRGGSYRIRISREEVSIAAHSDNPTAMRFIVGGRELAVAPGQDVCVPYEVD
ncbi:hypothetical protein D3C73_1664260 [compost metagenome]